jgi:hypothetical protein
MEDNLNIFLKNKNDNLKKNGRWPQKNENGRPPQKKMEDNLKTKWKTKINLIGCDTIVNSPS